MTGDDRATDGVGNPPAICPSIDFRPLAISDRRRGGSWGWSLLPRRARGVLRVQPDGHRITVRPVDHSPRASVTAATPRSIVGGSLRPVFYFFHEWVRVTILDAQGWGHPSDNADPRWPRVPRVPAVPVICTLSLCTPPFFGSFRLLNPGTGPRTPRTGGTRDAAAEGPSFRRPERRVQVATVALR